MDGEVRIVYHAVSSVKIRCSQSELLIAPLPKPSFLTETERQSGLPCHQLSRIAQDLVAGLKSSRHHLDMPR